MRLTAIWDDCAVPVGLDDPAFKERIERFLAVEAVASSERGCGAPTIELRRDGSGWKFETSLGPRAVEGDDNAAFMLFDILGYEFGLRTRRPVVHAGGFVADGGAVLYLGGLRQGKSRLTFAAWQRGYPVLGDDRIALHLDERAAKSLPKCLKLRLDDERVPSAWRTAVPRDAAFIGEFGNERRWVLSRRLPGVVDCESPVPVRAMALLRRVDAGPTRLDDVPVSAAFKETFPYTTLGDATPMDLLRFFKSYAPRGRLPRLNVAPDEIDEALSLLAGL